MEMGFVFSFFPFEHGQKALTARYLCGILSGTIFKNSVELVLQETSLLAHTLNEIKTLNILESSHSNYEIKMLQTEKGINTKKSEIHQVGHPSPGS